jgi:hypothetical protein
MLPDAAKRGNVCAMGTRCVAIVDGYSTGNFFPPAFHRLGVDAVHVQSSAQLIGSMLPPDLDAYRDNIVCPGGDPSVPVRLTRHRPVAVLAGSEAGVGLADTLSQRLGLPTNGTRLSTARRDKFQMIETLRAAGIRCARQFASPEPAEIVAWAGREGYPVVVKPLSSASSENVSICHGAPDVARAAAEVLGATTMFEQPNTAVLVQSYLAGTEYIVDTVSCHGQRYVCGVWEYEKTTSFAGRPLYDRDVLLDPTATPVSELIAYVDTVLDALDIRHGPAHAEVIMTPDGPTLVEIAARLNGNMNPGFHDRCLGANQTGLTALACADPDEFRLRYGGRVYSKLFDAAVHNTQTDRAGIVESIDQAVVDEIAALPTVHLVVVRLAPGDRLRSTTDLLSSPLRIFMVGDEAALRADHRVIGNLKDLVYRLSGDRT